MQRSRRRRVQRRRMSKMDHRKASKYIYSLEVTCHIRLFCTQGCICTQILFMFALRKTFVQLGVQYWTLHRNLQNQSVLDNFAHRYPLILALKSKFGPWPKTKVSVCHILGMIKEICTNCVAGSNFTILFYNLFNFRSGKPPPVAPKPKKSSITNTSSESLNSTGSQSKTNSTDATSQEKLESTESLELPTPPPVPSSPGREAPISFEEVSEQLTVE